MSDLISRQDAIDAIDKIFPADPMRNDYTQGITCGAALAEEYIKQLPSAEPEKRTEERTETHECDLISRQDAIDEIEERKNANGYSNVALISELNRLEGYIIRLPSAQSDKDINVPNTDTISRQDAIDAVKAYLSDCQIEDADWHGNGIEYELESLPSAQPEPYQAERRTDGIR